MEKKFGIINTAHKWCNNFLKLRKSRVCINGSYSSEWVTDFSLCQGSTQGAFLFNCYASTLSKNVPDSLMFNGFMDDHSIKRTFKPLMTNTNKVNKTPPENNTIAIMGKSMHDIKAWMEAVELKLNEAKTALIYFGSRQQLSKTIHTTINVIEELIERLTKVQYLGGHLDSNLTFKDDIHIKCKAATLSIIKICNIRKYLTRETCHKLILPLVISHLDYANSMLEGLPSSSIKNNAKITKHSCKTNPPEKMPWKAPQNASKSYIGYQYNRG